MTDWTACKYHAMEGTSAGGAALNGEAFHRCPDCAAATISALLAAVTVLTELVDGLATALSEHTADYGD